MGNEVINVKIQMTELERSYYNQQIKMNDPTSQTSNTALLVRIAAALEAQNTKLDDLITAIEAQNTKLDDIATAISQLDLTCTVNNYITPNENNS